MIEIDIKNLSISKWRRYIDSPSVHNLVMVLVDIVARWDFEGDPGDPASYAALSEDEFWQVRRSAGKAIMAFNTIRTAIETKPTPPPKKARRRKRRKK